MKYKLLFILSGLLLLIPESKAQNQETYLLHYPYNTQVGLNLNVNLRSKMRIEQYRTLDPSD